MKTIPWRFPVLIFGLMIFIIACSRNKEKISESGMRYIIYNEHSGPSAQQGDYVTVEIIYKTENDSILFDSRKSNAPLRFQLGQPPFQGSMEEGLTFLTEGDSATFYVSADSMVRKVFSRLGGADYVRPSFLKAGSFFEIRCQTFAHSE